MNTMTLSQSSLTGSVSVPATRLSSAKRWTARTMSYLPAAFLLLDATMKFVQPEPVLKGTVELGYPVESLPIMGVCLLVSTLLYLVPRTAILGAILLTGYFGGAIATHLRVDNPLFSHTLFPVYFAVLMWGGLWLRDQRLQSLLPLRKNSA